MKTWRGYMKEKMQDPEFKEYYDSIQGERDLSMALSDYRVKHDISQKELSKLTGVPQADISRMESLDANPSLKTLAKLAKGMGKKVRIIFEDIDS